MCTGFLVNNAFDHRENRFVFDLDWRNRELHFWAVLIVTVLHLNNPVGLAKRADLPLGQMTVLIVLHLIWNA